VTVSRVPATASWEEAVRDFRRDARNGSTILDNYFDLPVTRAARRYAASSEFRAIRPIVGRGPGRALDIGAGHGITSFALAALGWDVIALDPDASAEVGIGAIRTLPTGGIERIDGVIGSGERIPLRDESVDLVFGRQVLHHLADLDQGLREARRVLRPSGRLLFVREHVADDDAQLAEFLEGHPLHHAYGGEHAHPLEGYLRAFHDAGLSVVRCWGPLDSMINFYPGSRSRRLAAIGRSLARQRAWRAIVDPAARSAALNKTMREPGRLYSFLGSPR
jgi:SAM-dependent methyltransferase